MSSYDSNLRPSRYEYPQWCMVCGWPRQSDADFTTTVVGYVADAEGVMYPTYYITCVNCGQASHIAYNPVVSPPQTALQTKQLG